MSLSKGGTAKHKKYIRDTEVSSNPGIVRLTKQGGSVKVTKLVVEELKDIMKNRIAASIVKNAVTYMEHARRKTISLKDIVLAYEVEFGMKYYGEHPPSIACPKPKKLKGGKTKAGKTNNLLKQVRHYQKQSDCLLLQKAPFKMCMRELILQYGGRDADIRITKDAMLSLQNIVESFTVKIIENSVTVMTTCDGIILSTRHLQAALKIMNIRL